jgi:nitrogen-specific signal transduction histidine kinase/HAMP domain-containing protein
MSIQTRLFFAIGVLALSTMIVGLVSWYWLARSNEVLEDLHRTTLVEVNRSHELTKQSSVFTTSAPLLLSLKSSYLIESEGDKLLRSIDAAMVSWRSREAASEEVQQHFNRVVEALKSMRQAMLSVITETQSLSTMQDRMRLHITEVGQLERELIKLLHDRVDPADRDSIWKAQAAANSLITASSATSELSLGEYQRRFQQLTGKDREPQGLLGEVAKALITMRSVSVGGEGVFETRGDVLRHNLAIRKALNKISSNAAVLNTSVLALISISEQEILRRGTNTSKNLRYTKILVLVFGIGSIGVALTSAFYVSGYVVKNLNLVSNAMLTLAKDGIDESQQLNPPPKDEIGKLQASFGVFQENAIRLTYLNEQLLQKTALFESTFNNISDGVLIVDDGSRVLAHNPQVNKLLSGFGDDSRIKSGKRLSPTFTSVATEFDYGVSLEGISNYKERKNKLGQVLEFRVNDLPDGGSVWLISDTTERKRVEERLQHFQRLESLGQLTGEVAHDVNNILSTVKTILPLVANRRTDPKAHQSAIGKIEDAIDLGSSFTERLLAFARKQKLEPKVIELNELISGVSELIALSLGERIALDLCLLTQATYVKIDPLQLESTLLNLCINSAHAISEEGNVTISLVRIDDSAVDVIVEDNGSGMNATELKRAIEPFYSTRRNGNGCGLGLSIVYGFMKQSGGDMQMYSTEGVGTKVVLTLRLPTK